SGCDLVVFGTAVKDTIILYSTLKKLGWDKLAVTSMVPYMPLVAKAGEGTMNGLAGVVGIYDIDLETGNTAGKKFITDYKAAYDVAPTNQAQTGYVFADLTVKALELAGKNLTVESLVKALESMNNYIDPFGTSKASYGPKAHFGGNRATLVQIQNQNWEVVEESIPFD
ncbi:MAG: ABC transporter substrate-binding protein, partial [Deltaproteobacteria bacterium]